MNLTEFTSFNEFVLEGKKTIIKRKYTERHPEKTVQIKTPIRNKILGFISEKEKVSRNEFLEFLKGLNEETGRNTSFAWVRKNSHLVKRILEKNGTIFYALSEFGKRALARTKINEEDAATLQNTPGIGNVTMPTLTEPVSGNEHTSLNFEKLKIGSIITFLVPTEINTIATAEIKEFDKNKKYVIVSYNEKDIEVPLSNIKKI